jgi:hypothetical protein
MAKTNKINKIKVICNSVMVITPILPQMRVSEWELNRLPFRASTFV